MPAPTENQLEQFITQAFLNQGFQSYTYVNGVPTPASPPALSPAAAALVKALSTGITQQWAQWQAQQTVVVQVTTAPGVATGAAGTALP